MYVCDRTQVAGAIHELVSHNRADRMSASDENRKATFAIAIRERIL